MKKDGEERVWGRMDLEFGSRKEEKKRKEKKRKN